MDRARELFFAYDGSVFYMSRNGVDDEYRQYAVPKELEKQWMEELTATKLDLLDGPGYWHVASFLLHHRDTRHLTRLLNVKTRGESGHRCAYLEDLLRYVEMCVRVDAVNDIRVWEAAEYVLKQAQVLDADAGQGASRSRVSRILAAATELRSSTG